MTTRRRIISNSVFSYVGSVAVRAASSLLFLMLARQQGAGPAGVLSLGTTYLAVFGAVLWGWDELTVREVAREPAMTGRYFTHLMTLRLALGMVSLALLYGVVRLAGYEAATQQFLGVFALSLLADGVSAVLQALFTAHQRQDIPLAIALAVMAIKLGGGAWALFGVPGLLWGYSGLDGIAVSWVLGSGVGALLYLVAALIVLKPALVPLWPIARAWWRHVLRLAVPFTVIAVITILDWQLDTLLLSVMRGARDVGWYTAALTVFLALWMIPQAYRIAVYPEMVRLVAGPAGALERLYARSMRLMLALGLPIAAGLALVSAQLVPFLYRGDFGPSVPMLQVLGWALVPWFLMVPGVRLLVAHDRQGILAWYVGASLTLNAAANLLLIPGLGALGSSWARLLSSTIYYVLHYVTVRPYVPQFNLLRVAWRPALATAGMAALVWLARDRSLAIMLAVGLASYALFAWAIVLDSGERQNAGTWIVHITSRLAPSSRVGR